MTTYQSVYTVHNRAENPIDRLICEMTLLLGEETMYACYSLMSRCLLTMYLDKLETVIKQVKLVFKAMIAVSDCIRIDNYRIIKS